MKKINIVVSAVNLNKGGTLTIARDLLSELDLRSNLRVIALVHSKKDYPKFNRVKLFAIPEIKLSWLKRLYFEYITSAKIARKLKSEHWICIHDMSANISNGKQYVYCHNPSPFYKDIKLRDFKYDWKFCVFVFLYSYLYRINIKRNKYVFVQQQWIANAFSNKYRIDNCVVAHPTLPDVVQNIKPLPEPGRKIKVFYPSVPRIFKNFEVLFEAAEALVQEGNFTFEFIVTISGNENRYARELFSKYKTIPNISFVGFLDREAMAEHYIMSDILCFPSKLETWGLPITEAKNYGLHLMLADLPYAHETVGNYEAVSFFDPYDAKSLVNNLKSVYSHDLFKANRLHESSLDGWKQFVDFILKD